MYRFVVASLHTFSRGQYYIRRRLPRCGAECPSRRLAAAPTFSAAWFDRSGGARLVRDRDSGCRRTATFCSSDPDLYLLLGLRTCNPSPLEPRSRNTSRAADQLNKRFQFPTSQRSLRNLHRGLSSSLSPSYVRTIPVIIDRIMPSDAAAQSKPVEVFTTSNILLQALVDAGIKRAFVNLGSDHPALLEAFASRKKYGLESLEIVTCPNEVRAALPPSMRKATRLEA
jgi:hypothetical protein